MGTNCSTNLPLAEAVAADVLLLNGRRVHGYNFGSLHHQYRKPALATCVGMVAFATVQTSEAQEEQGSTAPSGYKCDSSAPIELAGQHLKIEPALFSDLVR